MRPLALLLLLLVVGCTPRDGECLWWAKQYVNTHSDWHKQYDTRPNLPAIAVVRTGPDTLHAIVVVAEDDEFYYFVDNGYMGHSGTVAKTVVIYWLRRRP